MPLSPLCRKTFLLKGNKKFRTLTKKSGVFFFFVFFFVFRDSYVIYIWVRTILCLFHIFMYGYVTLIYFVPGAKTSRSWHDYELGQRESKRRSGKRLRTVGNLFRTACSGDGWRERKHIFIYGYVTDLIEWITANWWLLNNSYQGVTILTET